MKKVIPSLLALATIGLSQAHAVVVNISGYDFDLDQFNGAEVFTTSSFQDGREFDQVTGTDQLTLAELAVGPGPNQFATDPGDFLSLGDDDTEEWLSLVYQTAFKVGPGQLSNFVVFEVASAISNVVDSEGLGFEISFDGKAIGDGTKSWVMPTLANSAHSTTGAIGSDNINYNIVAFDLTHADFGFSDGDMISKVDIRNKTGLGGSSDPDFIFAAHAGVAKAVPTGENTLALLAMAFSGLMYAARRKARRSC